jgi:hypothetical protein
MKRMLILFLFATCFFVGCSRKLDKFEGLVESSDLTNDTNGYKQNELLLKSITNKVWIKETWSGSETYEDMSFVITDIKQGKLEGQFLDEGILEPDSSLYSEKETDNMVLTGNYNEYKAELILKDGNKIKRKLNISIEKENLLRVDIQHTKQNKTQTYKFKPYNLKDLETDTRSEFDNDFTDITLGKWGEVKFVSVVRTETDTKRKVLFLYLVDDKDNILYEFSGSLAYPNDFKVKDFLFKDINDDGREDLLLILEGITDLKLHETMIYEQNEMGGFDINIKKTNKMNEEEKYSIQDIVD